MPYTTLPAVPHLMRGPFLRNFLVPEMSMVGKLWTGQILENSLLFLRRLLNAFIEFIFCGVLDFSRFLFEGLLMTWAVHTLFCSWLPGSGKL